MSKRFEVHSHTHYSNIRKFLDSINKPKVLIDYAREIGLAGISITDHECISSHMEANIYAQELLTKDPNFKVVLGNEIYLCGSRTPNQRYYHFILLAKNLNGHKALAELSSKACINSYFDRGLERGVTTYEDLYLILQKYPNSLIGTSACIGGELSCGIKRLIAARKAGDEFAEEIAYNDICNFIFYCQKTFGEDFYIECAPGRSKNQIEVNQYLFKLSQVFDIKIVLGTDAHYLKKEDRYVHKAYLNSSPKGNSEREIDDFYEYSYLQTEDEILENIAPSGLDYDLLCRNSMEIYDKIENYDLRNKQGIPTVEVKDYPKKDKLDKNKYPIISAMFQSDNQIERYWVNQCVERLEELHKDNDIYFARLEEEADTKKTIGEKLNTNMFAYPVTLQHYIDLIWECGSTVGAGRGSSCSGLNHYLLGVTQLDPIRWNLPWFRYLNKERIELPDIDIDISPSRRGKILQKIREERSNGFDKDIDEQSKSLLGCTLVATFGTESTKSTIQTACRGYRSEDCPTGIDTDIAQYLSSLVPVERGFAWSLSDVVNGNPDKDRQKIDTFVNEVSQYPGLLEIMFKIEGLVNKRSSHASGVIFFEGDPYEHCAFMKTPNGEIITQYDLHMCEAGGLTKFDFLVTEVQDKIIQTIDFLQEDNQIDSSLSLREVYDKYFNPEILPIDDERVWAAIQQANILDLFQLDSDIGRQGAKKIKPKNVEELADTNGLIRLMPSEKGAETPMEKYIRFKNNISLWYHEMDDYSLTKEEQKTLEPYFLQSYGVPPSQEQLMRMLMDENICHFSLKEANAARKIVGKKQMNKIPELHEKVVNQAASKALGKYIWDCGVGPQMGYSFSVIHALAYSFIGFQTAYLAVNWNPIYWNTACLIVNSASLELDDEDEDEDTKDKSTDYEKIAKALGAIVSAGIKVSPVDINHSDFGFKPDAEHNQILFGLKGLNKINGTIIDTIIEHRPYKGIADFIAKCNITTPAVISLIKAGAFDELDKEWASTICPSNPRKAIMTYYINVVSKPKTKLNLQNFNGLIESGIIPKKLDFYKNVFFFNKYLKNKSFDFSYEDYTFFRENEFDEDCIYMSPKGVAIDQQKWESFYTKSMAVIKSWIAENQQKLLEEYNGILFKNTWDKYAAGNVSAWEMESMCFYYHPHELKDVNTVKYGISKYSNLPYVPEVEKTFKRGGKVIPIFYTTKIIGTVISKNDTRASISILTPDSGVVNVKFTKEYYAEYKRQLSEKNADGKKTVIEKGWFSRGNLVMINGFRREDTFVAKTYSHTASHQLYKITTIDAAGNITIEHERAFVNE